MPVMPVRSAPSHVVVAMTETLDTERMYRAWNNLIAEGGYAYGYQGVSGHVWDAFVQEYARLSEAEGQRMSFPCERCGPLADGIRQVAYGSPPEEYMTAYKDLVQHISNHDVVPDDLKRLETLAATVQHLLLVRQAMAEVPS